MEKGNIVFLQELLKIRFHPGTLLSAEHHVAGPVVEGGAAGSHGRVGGGETQARTAQK